MMVPMIMIGMVMASLWMEMDDYDSEVGLEIEMEL